MSLGLRHSRPSGWRRPRPEGQGGGRLRAAGGGDAGRRAGEPGPWSLPALRRGQHSATGSDLLLELSRIFGRRRGDAPRGTLGSFRDRDLVAHGGGSPRGGGLSSRGFSPGSPKG